MKRKHIALAGICGAAALSVALMGASKSERDFKISKNLDIFFSVFKELNMFYVDEPDPDKIVPTAINEMLSSLDPYTTYIPEKDKEAYSFQINGEYGGVGSVITATDTDLIQIKEVYVGSPSFKNGLRAGDRFLSIGGESMRGKRVDEVSKKLRGKAGDVVSVEMERPGTPKPLKIDIRREVIKINAVDYHGLAAPGVGYISLHGFETDCAEEVRKAFLDLRDRQGAKKMILDLRNNPGGLLDEALQIVNFFVPADSKMLSTKGRRSSSDRDYTAFRQPVDTLMPIVVLISRGSASASEIVAGALQDLDRAVVAGQRSFGKGLVQATREVAYDGYLKVTTAKYYTPSGRCIQAIDYSNRDENGAVDYVPDSLITAFKTKGGRTVYDGGGISPDVMLSQHKYKPVMLSLVAGDYPFRYIMDLQARGLSLDTTPQGQMTDAALDDFIRFMGRQKKFTYKTLTQEAFEKAIAMAKAEDLYEPNKETITALEEQMRANLERDVHAAAAELKPFIENEAIVTSRYKRAAIAHSLRTDEEVAAAVELLADDARYRGLLDGTVESHAGDKRAAKGLAKPKKK